MSPESHSDALENLTEEQLRARLAERETTIAEVAALVARVRHEINNPLTGVLGHAQLLLREDLSEKARARVQKIEELAMRTTEIAAELRAVKRPE
ncbi:MAG: histidine kinase dimerization/phospho-acceptor domain-containing protein [Pyrinomonadaceae bacterium]